MKRRILILIMLLLLTTGCECEYNLTIDGNTYKEKINIIGETSEEIASFKNNWKIPIDKDKYNSISESDSNMDTNSEIYEYKLSESKLTFNYDFSRKEYINSTAVSNCYNKLTISNYNNTTVISTSSNSVCFEKNPPLTSVKINIKVDRPVIKSNADIINGNIYTWYINKTNANNKNINLILDNNQEKEEIITEQDNQNNNDETKTKNSIDRYIIYIFLGIVLLIIYFGYQWFMKFKEKNNDID